MTCHFLGQVRPSAVNLAIDAILQASYVAIRLMISLRTYHFLAETFNFFWAIVSTFLKPPIIKKKSHGWTEKDISADRLERLLVAVIGE